MSAISVQAAVVVFANDSRCDLARLDRHGLIDDALLLVVVAHFHMTGRREILAERMTDETVVGEDATKVEMTFEDYAVEVERLALEPCARAPDFGERLNDRHV